MENAVISLSQLYDDTVIDKLNVSFLRIFYVVLITHKITNCFVINLNIIVLGAHLSIGTYRTICFSWKKISG